MLAPVFERLVAELVPAAGPAVLSRGVLVFQLAPAELLPAVQRLKTAYAFDIFLDVTAVDWLGHEAGAPHKQRVRLKTRVPESDPSVDSLTAFYGSAAYMERECHDMYGIRFRGNADLRPILLYEGFQGHPLRKDYPKQQEQPLVPYRN